MIDSEYRQRLIDEGRLVPEENRELASTRGRPYLAIDRLGLEAARQELDPPWVRERRARADAEAAERIARRNGGFRGA